MALTIAEQAQHTTVKLTTYKSGIETGSGTAFFYRVQIDEKREAPLLVTNKHVLADNDQIVAICHVLDEDKTGPKGEFVRLVINIKNDFVIYHPNFDVDLCAIPIANLIELTAKAGKPVYMVALNSSNIPEEKQWENFDAIEELIMIGCPRGIYDEANNLPIFRKGNSASSLAKRYNGKDQFLVDMACFPGSSGSPIFLLSNLGFHDKAQNAFMMGQTRFFFLGVLFAGPMVSNTGQIILAQPPRIEIATMMHLGFALRSTEMFAIEEDLRRRVAATQP